MSAYHVGNTAGENVFQIAWCSAPIASADETQSTQLCHLTW